jgi:glycosyltransferase involved in cell wall biosynthesis
MYARGARIRLRALAPLDRVVAHFVVPCGWPLALGVDAELEVVAHGSDVRLLMAAPRVVRHALFRQLVAQGARFRFAAHALMDALDVTSRALIAERSVVRLPPVAVPDGWNGASLRPGYGAPMVVVVGRLVRDKRVDRAIDAMRAGELVVIGDGPERSRLVARAAQRGIAARFVGQLPRSQALEHIAAADVLLHASSLEGASTVIREARALGTAVVCCDAGDAARWAESDPGIHVSAPDDLGATLARVLSALG